MFGVQNVAVKVLNSVLSSYVENLDAEQLNFGLLSGDVELKDLKLKTSVLDDLDLPVKAIYGHIGLLRLKVPWLDLFKGHLIIQVKDVYAVVAPSQQIIYEHEAEKQKSYYAKMQKVHEYEEAYKKKRKTDMEGPQATKTESTYFERLLAQIIRNLQVVIENVHIKYVDKITKPEAPFAMGFTMSKLEIVSTDEQWKPGSVSFGDASKVYKITEIVGFAVYWNSKIQEARDAIPLSDYIDELRSEIASIDQKPKNFSYVLGPINASARLRLNTKPECDNPPFITPRVSLNLTMDELFIGITKDQYQDLIAVAESKDRMMRGERYRKYRPTVGSYANHYKLWWRFAYTCILEEDVRRKKRNWDWQHMKKYRQTYREYKDYRMKTIDSKPSKEMLERAREMEEVLDISDLILISRLVGLESIILEKKKVESQTKGGWFSWFSGGSKSKVASDKMDSKDLLKQVQEAMTEQDKEALREAIGAEDAPPVSFPDSYVDTTAVFLLKMLKIQMRDESCEEQIVLTSNLVDVKCRLETRAAARAMKIHIKIEKLDTFGKAQGSFIPRIIHCDAKDPSAGILEVMFETNPLDKSCGQRLELKSEPLEIIYDACTINKVIDVFKVPPSANLEQLQSAAGSGINNIKEKSVTGMQYAIDKNVFLDLNIRLAGPIIILPYAGKFTGYENVVVVNLGFLSINSIKRDPTKHLVALHAQGIKEDAIMEAVRSQSYDEIRMELSAIQVLIAQSDENWRDVITNIKLSEMHILTPVNLSISFFKCLISDDPRLPQVKITGELPRIHINLSDARLLLVLSLVTSIPFAPPQEEEKELAKSELLHGSSSMLLKTMDIEQPRIATLDIPDPTLEPESSEVQFTKLDAKFIMSEFEVSLFHQDDITSERNLMLTLKLESLECAYNQKTFVNTVDLRLRKLGLRHYRTVGDVDVISTPGLIDRESDYLIKVSFTQVNRKCYNFHTVYKSCESILDLKFATQNIILNQDGLISLMAYATELQQQVEEILVPENSNISTTLKRSISAASVTLSNVTSRMSAKAKQRPQRIVVETIKFKLCAELKELSIQFVSDTKQIAMFAIKGIDSEVIVKTAYTQVNARLQEIVVIDLNPETIHDMILSVTGTEAISVQLVMYNLEINETERHDMDIKVTTGGIRIIFLNWFVTNVLNFLNNFQAAQQKIIEASQAAAETAKQNVQDVYAKAKKISLNVNIKAPDVIVPINSKSLDAVLLDMGQIKLVNKFLDLDMKNEDGSAGVLENIKISLTELKLARVRLDTHSTIICEDELLKPITLKLSIKRNLSAAWYKAIPDLDISGQMQYIELDLSQADYKMIMKTLNENLSEGKPEEPTTQAAATQTEVIQSRNSVTRDPSKLETTQGDIEPAIHTFLRFTFSMEKLVIRLYTGGCETLTPENIEISHNEAAGLGQFSLEGLSIKGRILTDNSIVTSVLLVNCLLDDIRQGREDKLNRLIERKFEAPELDATNVSQSTDSLSQPKSMIDVTFQMKDGAMFVDVRIYSFTLILSMEYLLKIADFFTQGREPPPLKVEESTSKVVIKTKSDAKMGEDASSQMTINLKVEKPDIILVEHMDSIDTNAMMLQCQIIMKLRMSGTHQVINGSVNDLEIFACCYNPEKRAETRCDLLHPMTINLAGSTPENKGLHLEVLFTDIRLSVTPYTIELLSRVLAAMSPKSNAEEDEQSITLSQENLWVERSYVDSEFWFLKPETAAEATEEIAVVMVPDSATVLSVTPLQELCIISMQSIVITVEVGTGNKTIPMLLMDSSFKGNVKNWSSQMLVEASLTLQMGYFNGALAMWEPLVEPVEIIKQDQNIFVPWELRLEVSMNEQDDTSATSPTDEESREPQPAVMSIDIISENNLELTVTKTFLEILTILKQAFATAIEQGLAPQEVYVAPYKVVNQTGEPVTIMLEKSSFVMSDDEDLKDVVLEDFAEMPIKRKASHEPSSVLPSTRDMNVTTTRHFSLSVQFQVEGRWTELHLPIVRADKRFFMLNYRGEGNDNYGLISDIKIDSGVTVITLRSILQVYNHFTIPIEVYYMTARGDHLKSIAHVEPGGVVNIPLKAVYTPTKELFFSVEGYTVTTSPYIWKDLQTDLSISKLLYCIPKTRDQGPEKFYLKAVGEMEQVYYESSLRHTMASTCYNIHLRPAVTLKNLLPMEIVCCVENMVEEKKAEAGKARPLPNVEPGKSTIIIRLSDYLEKEWSCRYELPLEPAEFSVVTFISYDSAAKMTLDLGMHCASKGGSIVLSLYCPFWMLNKTGLLLAYRTSDDSLNVLHHPPDFKGPILFSFHAKHFFGKKKAAIRVENGEWSDKFSLDVAGSSGVVTCKANDMIYQVGVRNQLTYNSFTKQVVFTPYYVVINNASFTIECQENDRPADPWLSIEPKSCAALWPHSDLDSKLLRLKIAGTTEVTASFLYTESHVTLLKLPNKFGGINVDIQITEGGFYINLAQYEDGMAPALLINHTQYTMNYWEKESVQLRHIKPKHCTYYTWDNPSGPRVLVWEGGEKKEMENDLRRDGVEGYSVTENYTVYWVSFLYGMQRVLLFTDNKSVAADAMSAKQFELIDKEITVSFHGLGLSLINNEKRQEIMYMGIASSGIIWETCKMKGRRFKPMSLKNSLNMEAAYERYQQRCEQYPSETEFGREVVDDKTEVDFKLGQMFKPHKRLIRRTFQTGLWIQMKTSPTQLQLHGKINRLQIDDQMYGVFPIVLAPVPPPKSVAVDSGIKPFAELSIVQLLVKNSQIKQFKYFKVLIQEFHIKVDMGFINAIQNLFVSEKTDEEERNLFLTDMKLVDEALYNHVCTYSLQEQKSFYDLLHFSPLKIHVSFSIAGLNADEATPSFMNILFQSLGVTLADLQDIVFKLAFFEREFVFLTNQQLQTEVWSHYQGQILKQFYVLVFGLDVIGNPYGLVVGISKGVEDLFYEPFQGAIQGPDEFAEGLALGMKSLFGHTVGGAADAASRITGAMGKGIAALTFDKDYQKKRRDQLNRRPATVQEGIARSGKGLVMGVVDGVTGVFTKPASGWKEEGAGGLLKGLGKGAVGLIARPTAGVIDFASGSLDTIKRATELNEETMKLRPPRFLHADGLIRPYKRHEAEGNKFLTDLEKGKYASTDVYCGHYVIIEKKDVLLLTDKRMAFITHNDIFGGWQVDWYITWKELRHPARVVTRGVAITTSEPKKKKLGLFGSSDTQKIILIQDPAKREEICQKIESLRGSD